MPKLSSPYKNNIWQRDPRYDLDRSSLSAEDFETISRLGSVDIAKKQIPPVPGMALLEIYRSIKQLPAANVARAEHLHGFLVATLPFHGAGIPTLICMLAVESKGDYPPMDRKFSSGLRAQGVITGAEEKQLNGKAPMPFSRIYVAKVIPAWLQSLKTRTAEQADSYWGRGGVDET